MGGLCSSRAAVQGEEAANETTAFVEKIEISKHRQSIASRSRKGMLRASGRTGTGSFRLEKSTNSLMGGVNEETGLSKYEFAPAVDTKHRGSMDPSQVNIPQHLSSLGFDRANVVRLDEFLSAIKRRLLPDEDLGPRDRDILLCHMYSPEILDNLAAFGTEEQAQATVHRDEVAQFVLLHFRMGVTDYGSFFESHALLQLCLLCNNKKRVLKKDFELLDGLSVKAAASKQRRRSVESSGTKKTGPRISVMGTGHFSQAKSPQTLHSGKQRSAGFANSATSPLQRHSMLASSMRGKTVPENEDCFSDIRQEGDDDVPQIEDPVGYQDSMFRESEHAERQTYEYNNDYIRSKARVSRTNIGGEMSRVSRTNVGGEMSRVSRTNVGGFGMTPNPHFNAQEPISILPPKTLNHRRSKPEGSLKSEKFPDLSPFASRATSPRNVDNVLTRSTRPPINFAFQDFDNDNTESAQGILVPFNRGSGTPKVPKSKTAPTPRLSRARSTETETRIDEARSPQSANMTKYYSLQRFPSGARSNTKTPPFPVDHDRQSSDRVSGSSPPGMNTVKQHTVITLNCAQMSLDP
jgi:hypothetical protein